MKILGVLLIAMACSVWGKQPLPSSSEFALYQEMRYMMWKDTLVEAEFGSLESALLSDYPGAFETALKVAVLHGLKTKVESVVEEYKEIGNSERLNLISVAMRSGPLSVEEQVDAVDREYRSFLNDLKFVAKVKEIRSGKSDIHFSRALTEQEKLLVDLAYKEKTVVVSELVGALAKSTEFGDEEENYIASLRTYQDEAKDVLLELLLSEGLVESSTVAGRELLLFCLNENRLRGDVEVYEALFLLKKKAQQNQELHHLLPALRL